MAPAVSYPPGVATSFLSLAVAGMDGKSLGGRWTVELSRPLLWAATRRPVLATPVTVTLQGLPQLLLRVPVTGQAGFVDPVTGQAVSSWGYTVTYAPLRSAPMVAAGVQVAADVVTAVGPLLRPVFWPHAETEEPGDVHGVVFGVDPDGQPYALVPPEFFDADGQPFFYATGSQLDPDGQPVINA